MKKSAFTLLEIMVSIALLAMIIMAFYSSWNAIMKSTRVAVDAAAAAQRERITMRALHDSLVCACMFNANPTNYVFVAETPSDNTYLSFVARLPRSFPRGGKYGDFAIRRLEFKVEDAADNTKQLVMRQRPLLMDYDKDELNFPLILARDVSKFEVEFVDPQTGDWVSEWTLTNQLPKEARVTLGLGHLDQFSTHAQETMVSVVALPNQSVRVEWQTAGGPFGGGAPGMPGNVGNPGNTPNPLNLLRH